jgi:hypothetical protein
MRKKTYKALALALLLALGLAVSAYATPEKSWWPRTTTATTTAATTTDSTGAPTTTDSTTTTSQSTTTSSAKIWSPALNSAWMARYSNVILGVTASGAVAGGTCLISWGDGTSGDAPLVANGSGYSCSATHQYPPNPPGVSYTRPTITVVVADASGLPVSSDSTQIWVLS